MGEQFSQSSLQDLILELRLPNESSVLAEQKQQLRLLVCVYIL